MNRRELLVAFGSVAAAVAASKVLPAVARQQMELTLMDVPVPEGLSYQWNLPEMITEASGWVRVPDDRHGGSEVGGLILCERPIERTRAALENETARAHAQVDKWQSDTGGGAVVRVGGQFDDPFAIDSIRYEFSKDVGVET